MEGIQFLTPASEGTQFKHDLQDDAASWPPVILAVIDLTSGSVGVNRMTLL